MLKVLIADDSAFMRKVLGDILSSDPEIEVVGTARDGIDCIDKVKKLKPDVLTLDIEMPGMNGIDALRNIMKDNPLPVVMISALTDAGSKYTLDALSIGAIDFITKPSGSISLDMIEKKSEIIMKVKSAGRSKLQKYRLMNPIVQKFNPTSRKIVVIASSTGGPGTLEVIITALPNNFPVPVLIVQHMPELFTKSLAERLNRLSQVHVKEAEDGEIIKNGVVYVAPGNFHMRLKKDLSGNEIIILSQEPRELGVRPNANFMMESAAEIYHERTIGVVLTGMGNDGTEGSKKIKSYEGTIIVESEESCVIYGMPKCVVESGYFDAVVPLPEIATTLVQLVGL